MVAATTGHLETYSVPHTTAWNTILGLEKQILWQHANNKTCQAEVLLGNAAADVREAKAKADDAEKITGTVQKNAAATKAKADKIFADVTGLAREVDDMMKQLQNAEKELKRKQDDAEQGMMMASMGSQAAQEAEDNARKAKNPVSSLLSVINDLLDQLGQLEMVDLNKLSEIEGTLNSATDQTKDSDLDQKLSFLEREARKQDDAIQSYNRDIEEILTDISNLEDIKKTLPSGRFNTPFIES
ncbi:laminin subunit gamma-1-like [Pezoporus flaviventris]|uniref:laminin subunit gamma-1-like n=1 Tax=Pezoporus flaviventris TaxID=889875 RepID=UPI002AB08419|nr:laminin subunit gamma-1-like [Pezoporus flaviventris]